MSRFFALLVLVAAAPLAAQSGDALSRRADAEARGLARQRATPSGLKTRYRTTVRATMT